MALNQLRLDEGTLTFNDKTATQKFKDKEHQKLKDLYNTIKHSTVRLREKLKTPDDLSKHEKHPLIFSKAKRLLDDIENTLGKQNDGRLPHFKSIKPLFLEPKEEETSTPSPASTDSISFIRI